jgi:hypothetical protein
VHLQVFYRPANAVLLVALLLAATIRPLAADVHFSGNQDNHGEYQDLVELLDARQIIRDVAGQGIDPVADYGKESIAWQSEQMRQFQARLTALDVTSWTRAQQVDYLAVRSRLDQFQFILQVTRPWALLR